MIDREVLVPSAGGSPDVERWSFLFFVLALVSALFGFTDIAASAASVARLLFFLFVVFLVVSVILGRRNLRSES